MNRSSRSAGRAGLRDSDPLQPARVQRIQPGRLPARARTAGPSRLPGRWLLRRWLNCAELMLTESAFLAPGALEARSRNLRGEHVE